jgi:hypothetical protein
MGRAKFSKTGKEGAKRGELWALLASVVCSPRSEIVPLRLRINDLSSTNPEVAASLNSDRGECLIVPGGIGGKGWGR